MAARATPPRRTGADPAPPAAPPARRRPSGPPPPPARRGRATAPPPPPRRGRRARVRGRWRAIVVAVLAAVVTVGVVGLASMQQQRATRSGAADASSYTPPALATPGATSTPANSGPIVTIIGDDQSVGPAADSGALWTTIVQRDLGVQANVLAATGAGYLRSPPGGAERTFGALAAQVPADAEVVVFVGGANDAGASALSITRAASAAFSAARSAARNATIVAVGPLAANGAAGASELAVRDAVKAATQTGDVGWIDPISSRWFTGTRSVESDGVTLTEDGERRLAARVDAALRPSVR